MEISRRVYFVVKNTKLNQEQKDHLIHKSEIPGVRSSNKKKARRRKNCSSLVFDVQVGENG